MEKEFYKDFVFNDTITVTENIYSFLRDQIISCNLKPLHRLSEKDVADALKVSRTPVRESFIRLKKENLVDILPQRGTFVSKINLKEVEEGIFIRRNLENAIMKKALLKIEKNAIKELKFCITKQREASRNKDYFKFLKYDNYFHMNIYMGCKMEKTWEVVESSGKQYSRLRLLTLSKKLKCDKLINEHEEILDCILNKKPEKIETLLQKHLSGIKLEEKELKKSYPNYFL